MTARKVDPDRLLALRQQGLLDVELCRVFGVTRKVIEKWRKRLGLPGFTRGPRLPSTRAKLAASYRRQMAAAGVRCINDLNPDWRRKKATDLARRFGLPAELWGTQVRIVLALAAGPMTAATLARVLGRKRQPNPFHSLNCRQVPGGNYLTDLCRRGLVAYSPRTRGEGNGSGRAEGLYWLTVPCLARLKEATG